MAITRVSNQRRLDSADVARQVKGWTRQEWEEAHWAFQQGSARATVTGGTWIAGSVFLDIAALVLTAIGDATHFIAVERQAPRDAEAWLQRLWNAIDKLENMPRRCPVDPIQSERGSRTVVALDLPFDWHPEQPTS